MKKIKPNDLCYCGSGRKYKKCHYRSDVERDLTTEKIINDFKKTQIECEKQIIQNNQIINSLSSLDIDFEEDKTRDNLEKQYKETNIKIHNSRKKVVIKNCLFPNCKKKTIASHAISESCILKQLAENGHVYSYTKDATGVTHMVKRGIHQATTFNGFCSEHDSKLFEKIDNLKTPFDDETLFLMSYRSLCATYQSIFEENKFEKFIGFDLCSASLLPNLNYCKHKFDILLIQNRYDLIHNYIFVFDYKINFAGSAVYTLYDNLNNDCLLHIYPNLFINIFPFQEKSYVVLSWFKDDDDVFKSFIQRIINLPKDKLTQYFSGLIIYNKQNFVIKPSVWENLKDKHYKLIYHISEYLFDYELLLEEIFQTDFDLFKY